MLHDVTMNKEEVGPGQVLVTRPSCLEIGWADHDGDDGGNGDGGGFGGGELMSIGNGPSSGERW